MELLSRAILFLENHFLLSKTSKDIIQWTIFLLILFTIFTIVKKELIPSLYLYIGIAIRLILLVGLSIEMLHQVNVTELTEIYKYTSFRQFLHYMFFGYIVVVGFYYILTIHIRKYKGLLFTFDIAVLTMPVIHYITSYALFMHKNEVPLLANSVIILIILNVTAGTLLLFYKGYWEKRKRYLIPFFALSMAIIFYEYKTQYGKQESTEFINLFLFLCLVMTYHLLSTSKHKIVRNSSSTLKLAISFIFLLLINPIYNLGDAAFALTDAEVRLRYYESTDLVSFDEAERIAESLTGEQTFHLNQRPSEDFHNVYHFENEDYLVRINGNSGFVDQFERKTKPEGEYLEKDKYIQISKDVLKTLGRELKTENIQISVTQTNERIEVKMIPTLNDHSTLEHTWGVAFTWERESLMNFQEKGLVYPLKSLKGINVSEQDVKDKVVDWYKKLEQDPPPFVINDVLYGYSNRTIDINIRTKTDHITIDARTGELLNFSGQLENYKTLKYGNFEVNKIQEEGIMVSEWKRARHDSSWFWTQSKTVKGTIPYSYYFSYTDGEPYFSYGKFIDYNRLPKSTTKNKSRESAYKAVINDGFNERIYAKRAKLTHVFDEGKLKEAWLIVVQPFGSSEHQLYLVDAETNEVTNLYE